MQTWSNSLVGKPSFSCALTKLFWVILWHLWRFKGIWPPEFWLTLLQLSGLSHWVATELVGSCPLDVVLTMSDPVLHLQYVLLVEAEWCVVFKISAREGHGSWISLSLCDNAESSLHILTSHSGFLSVEVWGSLWPHSGNKSTCREKKSVAPMVMICCKDTD